ncbi:MAG: amidohydrolase [Deltaproteobacteria bacterium]|nr:amidohydrolase [Deltaproteobacteria bacterium]
MKQEIIDAHTHVFPENVAPKVLDSNRALGFDAFGEGTLGDLRGRMHKLGINACVVLAVSTLPRLVEPSNSWLLRERDEEMIPFGTIHPEYQGYRQEIKRIKAMGARGIKFSSLFQDFYPDDRNMYPVYDVLVEEELPVLFHVGGSMRSIEGEEAMASPRRIARVLNDFPEMKVIGAHWGGFHALEEARKHLWGRDLYLDTSYPPGLNTVPLKAILEFIEAHGPNRILFASDYPFGDQESDIGIIQDLPLDSEARYRILYGNAAELFGIEKRD